MTVTSVVMHSRPLWNRIEILIYSQSQRRAGEVRVGSWVSPYQARAARERTATNSFMAAAEAK